MRYYYIPIKEAAKPRTHQLLWKICDLEVPEGTQPKILGKSLGIKVSLTADGADLLIGFPEGLQEKVTELLAEHGFPPQDVPTSEVPPQTDTPQPFASPFQ